MRYSDCPPFDSAFREAEWSRQADGAQGQHLQIVWREQALHELRAAIAGGCMRFVSSEQVCVFERGGLEGAKEPLHGCAAAGLAPYSSSCVQELVALAAAVLRGEPRSVYRRTKCSAESYGFSLDGVDIVTECASLRVFVGRAA